MRADEPVGRCAADEKAAPEKPEVAGANSEAQSGEGVADRTASGEGRAVCLRRAVRADPQVAWAIAKQQGDDRNDGKGRGADRDRGPAPALVLRKPAESRKEDQLAGRARRGQRAADGAPAMH